MNDKRTVKILRALAILLICTNLILVLSQFRYGGLRSGTELADAKIFANGLISDLQDLAATLQVAGKSSVKQALAKLHYDVFLADDLSDLAGIMQHNAGQTRDLIVGEYTRQNADVVLSLLNASSEVQQGSAQSILTVEPLPTGGYEVIPRDYLGDDTVEQLKDVENLLVSNALYQYFEPYRHLASFSVLVEKGAAQLVSKTQEQDTVKYLEGEIEVLRTEHTRVNKIAGFAQMTGPGVVISVYDQVFSVSAGDLRRIVGELFSAGATAIAVNRHRLAVTSYIIDSEEGIIVDGTRIWTNPIVIEAIGDPTTLIAGVDLLFSVALKGMLSFEIESSESIVLQEKAIH